MVVDTSAVLAILFQEDDAAAYAAAIADADHVVISAVSYVELSIVALSRGARGRTELDGTLEHAGIEILPVRVDQARLAVDAYDRFGKRRHPAGLNFGDCFAYGLARSLSEPLLFKGTDFSLTDCLRV